MLNKLSRYTIVLLIVFACALFLPGFYSQLFDKKVNTPRLSYSAVSKSFVYSLHQGMGKTEYKDIDGTEYSEREFFQLQPFSYYATLEKWNQLPESIDGFELNSKSIRRNSQFFRIAPKYIGEPMIPIYMMFEADPNYASLVVPDDVFRMTKRMEYINPNTNTVMEEKSELFTDAMLEAGFVFPAKNLGGNPTNRKPFDEGWFIEDANSNVFHVKMIHDEPFVVKTGIPSDLNIQGIYIKENSRKEFYGYILTHDNRVFIITYDNYKLTELPTALPEELGGHFASADMNYMVTIDPVNISVNIKGDGFTYMEVLSKEYKTITSHFETWQAYDQRPSTKVKKYIFPFELSTYCPNGHISLDMECFMWQGLIGIAASLLALFIVTRKRYSVWFDYVIVLFTGIFGLIAVLLIKPEE